jgi:hypothetical protein
MSEFSPSGKFEKESRISHSYIINDEEVKTYLEHCTIPAHAKNVSLNEGLIHDITYPDDCSIDYYITVDGEDTRIPINQGFPSSLLTFFQFGSLVIVGADLDDMEKKPFVSAEDIKKLKEIKREKFVLPTKNVALQGGLDFRTVVRNAIQDFFRKEHSSNTSLLETVFWFLFEAYDLGSNMQEYILSQCPHCLTAKIALKKDQMRRPAYSWECTHPDCKKEIYITDVFRLFERVDNETGAEGIVVYLKNVIETFLIVHTIKSLLDIEEGLIDRFLFVKDGTLSFGGESANMHRPMQALINYLSRNNNINLVGVESSGPFVEHAKQIRDKLRPGQAFLLSNQHIYTYILVGDNKAQEYGTSTYYSGKMIYKSLDERMYVLTMPVENHRTYYSRPELADFRNIQEVLFSIARLRCDIYENALIPIAVVNKLISLSTQSGTKILEKFAKKTMKQ